MVRKRKVVQMLEEAATAVKKARRLFRYAFVDEDEVRRDSASSTAEIAERETDTRQKRRKLCQCQKEQYAAAEEVFSLVENAFPELGPKVHDRPQGPAA